MSARNKGKINSILLLGVYGMGWNDIFGWRIHRRTGHFTPLAHAA